METIIRNHQQLQYAEVYISDIPSLKNIFLQVQNSSKLSKEFGVPFLLVKKNNQILGFASLIINGKGEISFTIHGKNELSDSEKKNFNLRAERYFKQNNSGNFRNADQLKSSIERMTGWLNVG
ncbi:hypothetical protein ACM40_04550 [Chryseobacterium sp. BLS98]|uniref:hypothetical protein n=1 Tax=Chryseobacterium sp. BLS98 TaxID=885586 RepID=UPI00065AC3AC|nr:hypothetical protein [Chryseobacterium sp. BLS98]KMQ64032.1 hypothetical protein ACM40_04550 [Chryseobacterium sp. BLS98]